MNHKVQFLISADLSIFFTKNQQIFLYQEIHIESLQIVLISLFRILLMLGKMATLGLLKTKIF